MMPRRMNGAIGHFALGDLLVHDPPSQILLPRGLGGLLRGPVLGLLGRALPTALQAAKGAHEVLQPELRGPQPRHGHQPPEVLVGQPVGAEVALERLQVHHISQRLADLLHGDPASGVLVQSVEEQAHLGVPEGHMRGEARRQEGRVRHGLALHACHGRSESLCLGLAHLGPRHQRLREVLNCDLAGALRVQGLELVCPLRDLIRRGDRRHGSEHRSLQRVAAREGPHALENVGVQGEGLHRLRVVQVGCKPRVIICRLGVQAKRDVDLQQLGNEVLGLLGDARPPVLAEVENAPLDQQVGRAVVPAHEGRPSVQEDVSDDTQRPHVALLVVGARKHFGGHVV
mmetsp:Transcript_123519/g.395110  ORF Transcript_123519/g.395110 Transcript_123519/m.395110 type:complete len:343 (-) Transcript_123519:1173-2201(-)